MVLEIRDTGHSWEVYWVEEKRVVGECEYDATNKEEMKEKTRYILDSNMLHTEED